MISALQSQMEELKQAKATADAALHMSDDKAEIGRLEAALEESRSLSQTQTQLLKHKEQALEEITKKYGQALEESEKKSLQITDLDEKFAALEAARSIPQDLQSLSREIMSLKQEKNQLQTGFSASVKKYSEASVALSDHKEKLVSISLQFGQVSEERDELQKLCKASVEKQIQQAAKIEKLIDEKLALQDQNRLLTTDFMEMQTKIESVSEIENGRDKSDEKVRHLEQALEEEKKAHAMAQARYQISTTSQLPGQNVSLEEELSLKALEDLRAKYKKVKAEKLILVKEIKKLRSASNLNS